jgi:competence protein ComEA
MGAIIVGVAIAVGGGLGATERPKQVSSASDFSTISRSVIVEIHVAGWVVSPGVVEVVEGSIVADAVEAAGGLRTGALVDQINLAAPVRSGDQVIVPGPDDLEAGNQEGPLRLNRATSSELQTLPGVGPVLAERIVSYREVNGPFQQVEDLLQVPGIGEAKLSSIRDLVRVP